MTQRQKPVTGVTVIASFVKVKRAEAATVGNDTLQISERTSSFKFTVLSDWCLCLPLLRLYS